MPKHQIKTDAKTAFKLINLIKAVKQGKKVKVTPLTGLQKTLLGEVMVGFFKTIKDIKDEVQ
jgi:hypothetical protein